MTYLISTCQIRFRVVLSRGSLLQTDCCQSSVSLSAQIMVIRSYNQCFWDH